MPYVSIGYPGPQFSPQRYGRGASGKAGPAMFRFGGLSGCAARGGGLGDCLDPATGDTVICPPGQTCDPITGGCYVPGGPADCVPAGFVGPLAPGQNYCPVSSTATLPANVASIFTQVESYASSNPLTFWSMIGGGLLLLMALGKK